MDLYRCIAVISAVIISTAPCSSMEDPPMVMYSAIGSTVNLTCNLNVHRMYVIWLGPPNLTVYAVGNEVRQTKQFIIEITGNEQINQHILQILEMKETNEGLYKCTATGGQHRFELLIQKPPTDISILGGYNRSVMFGVLHQQVTLTCNVEPGKPPEIMQWKYGHKIVVQGGPVTITYTFIPDVTHHLKKFSCIAFNNVTRTVLTQTMLLYLYIEPTVKIVTDRGGNISEHETLMLQCNYTSNDDTNTSVTWKYTSNGRNKYIQANNKSLKVEHIERTDAGIYTCVVSNSAGNANDTVTVNVLYSPEINITFENINSNKILRCNAYGNPADYVFSAWQHRTEYGDHIRFLNDNGNGLITLYHSPGKTETNQEQGIYTCSVSNGVSYDGEMYRHANYTLKQNGIPYYVALNKKIQYGILGTKTNITLSVVSHPIIKTVTIYKNNLMTDIKYEMEFSKIYDIVYGKKVKIKGYNIFVPIKITAPSYFTTYTVVVSNDYGQCHISVDLSPARPPRAPDNLKAVALDHTILLKWRADFDIGLHKSFYVEYRKILESSWTPVHVEGRSTAVLNGLELDTVYLLRMYAKTKTGESHRTEEIIVKTEKHLSKNDVFTGEIILVIGAMLLLMFLCWLGTKALKTRQCRFRNQDRGSSPHRNEETFIRPVHYDEIDSMYYNPINVISFHRDTRHNAQHEIQHPSIAEDGDSTAHDRSNRKTLPYAVHKFKPIEKTDSPRSSSDDSYLVPCRNYIELDIEKENENELKDMNTEEPEINLDQSSDSSDNSETNIKAIGRYEALKLCDMNKHSYKKYADIDE